MPNPSLPTYDLHELAAPLLAVVDAAPEQFARLWALQTLLLAGQPVSQERIASRLHVTPEEIPALLQGTELDAAGNFVGFGLTLVPTPHSYQINGRQFYVWCAGDAITFPILHKTSAVIASPDPITGETVRLMGTPTGARDVEPSTAVVSWVRRPSGMTTLATVRSAFCNRIHFFASVATASAYVAPHPELVIVPIDDVFQIGQLLWEREPLKSMMAALA
jgi:alkylmercury lyase